MKKYLVKRNRTNVLIVGTVGSKNQKGEYVNNGVAGSVQIMPGVNYLDEHDYKVLTAHPDWIEMVDNEEMEDISIPEAPKGKEDYPLAGMNPKQAIKLVRETVKKDLLETWEIQEQRAEVVKAIKEQLKVLELPPVKENKEPETT